VGLASELERAQARIAELEARLGRDSTNSSIPPSADSIAAKAKRRADRSSRERSADRQPGGQPGRKGSGLAPTVTPDRTETLPAPGDCSGCGADLADAVDTSLTWAQVWDLPPIALEKVPYLLPRRRCCGKITTAVPPFGAAGCVTYGPNVNAAAILLASEGNVPLERTAMLMAALLEAPVSTGFVARARERLAQRLAAARFDEAITQALRAEDVLCADETPTNVVDHDTDAPSQPVPGSPPAVTVRTPDARLVWYTPIGSPVQDLPRRPGRASGLRRLPGPRRLCRLVPARHPGRKGSIRPRMSRSADERPTWTSGIR
jgi:transposase